MATALSNGAIRGIFTDAKPARPVVQLINAKAVLQADGSAPKKVKAEISDGEEFGIAVLTSSVAEKLAAGKIAVNDAVRLMNYMVTRLGNTQICLVLDCECAEELGEKVGEPVSWAAAATPLPAPAATVPPGKAPVEAPAAKTPSTKAPRKRPKDAPPLKLKRKYGERESDCERESDYDSESGYDSSDYYDRYHNRLDARDGNWYDMEDNCWGTEMPTRKLRPEEWCDEDEEDGEDECLTFDEWYEKTHGVKPSPPRWNKLKKGYKRKV